MKKIILSLACLLALSCSSEEIEKDFSESVVQPETIPTEETAAPGIVEETPIDSIAPIKEAPEIEMGALNYSGQIPGKVSKIPTCKDGIPAIVHFDLLDSQGTRWISEKPVMEVDGYYISETDSLPIGNYELQYVYLMSAQMDTLYAIPTQGDAEYVDYTDSVGNTGNPNSLAQWSDLVLPIPLTITDTETTIEGTALCVIPENLPIPGELGGGINTGRLQTVPIYITGKEDKGGFTMDGIYYPEMDLCADYFTVTIDAYRTPERYTWSQFNQYHIMIPVDYKYLRIDTYDLDSDNPNAMETKEFGVNSPNGMYDPAIHGALIFDKCDE